MKAYVFLALLSTAYGATDFELRCAEKPERGPCDMDLPRWWYNKESDKCELFSYSGCGGNGNVYITKEHCEWKCMAKEHPIQSVCHRPPHRGPCLGNLLRFYFYHNEGRCRPFVYGGCQSNGNNFETIADCMKECRGIA